MNPRSVTHGYLDYDQLVETMEAMAREKPHLARVYSIGGSHEGRDLWMVEITDQSTGEASTKPGYYIDGNHHAVEVAGSQVCLYTALHLLQQHGIDPAITDLLGSVAFYILPRVSPDGAETFLKTPYSLRSSTRSYPHSSPEPGLHPEDVDGDGLILQMRIADPQGEWKVSERDHRLMVRRRPDEWGGHYYRLYPEGVLHHWDGGEIKIAPSRWGLDLNRNYPFSWGGEADRKVAGPYPLSEPETRAVADFISSRPNLAGAMSYHTTGGFILRPSCHLGDQDLNSEDLEMMKAIGRRGEELVGYPCVSTFEGFTGRRALAGVFMDWLYEDQGIIAFSTELWDLARRAGVEHRTEPLSEREEEERGLKMLAFSDKELGSSGFVPWKEHEHPQLGRVELGGWDYKFTLWNPPLVFLPGECHKNALFTLAHAGSLPRLSVTERRVSRLAPGVFSLEARVCNGGYLPSYVASTGKDMPWLKPPTARLAVPEGGRLLYGLETSEIDHLEGRSAARKGSSAQGRERRLLWVVELEETGEPVESVSLVIAGHRIGELSVSWDLEETKT